MISEVWVVGRGECVVKIGMQQNGQTQTGLHPGLYLVSGRLLQGSTGDPKETPHNNSLKQSETSKHLVVGWSDLAL